MSELTPAVKAIVAALAPFGNDVDADVEKMAAMQVALYLLADKYGRNIEVTTGHLIQSYQDVAVELNAIKNAGVSF